MNTQMDFDGLTLVDKSIMRLKEFEPPDGYYLAFSGGKDSVVLYDLAIKSGVKFDAHYAVDGIDPPELMQFIRSNYPSVIWEKPKTPFWVEFPKRGLPRRQSRWCCELIKEQGGKGRMVITGIRWAESARRKKRHMVELCNNQSKSFLHPIIDWDEKAIWGYIKANKIPYCSLYDEGFKRLGCVLCPMKTPAQTKRELLRFQKVAENWHRATIRLYNAHKDRESYKRWKTAEEMWLWWLSRKGERIPAEQCQMILGDN